MVTPQVVKRFRSANTRGRFISEGSGKIRLRADLFKPGNEQQLAKTLAHEIGHLADWLPDRVLKRGNMLGHLQTLSRFLMGEYTDVDGITIKNKEVRAELLALSTKWRTWDPATASESFTKYRKSAAELYADAISALLNNPGYVQNEAPIFFDQFFKELDKKPEVKKAFFEMWAMMAGTREELIARRDANVETMFGLGNIKSLDLLKLKRNARKLDFTDAYYHTSRVASDVISGLRTRGWEKHDPFQRRLREDVSAARKQAGTRWYGRGGPLWGQSPMTIASEENPFFALSERSYRLAGQVKAWLQQTIQPIVSSLEAHQLTWVDFGKVLFYERIISGDRDKIANPKGLSPASAQEQLNALMKTWTGEQQVVMRRAVDKFRNAVKHVARDAYDAGLYTEETWKKINANQAYATFHSLDHIEDPISSRIHHQTGMLGDIRNPGDATILKVVVTLRAIEHQRVKVMGFNYLQQFRPTEIRNAKIVQNRPVDPPKSERDKLRLVTYFDKGRLRGKYVDHYIADSLENMTVLQNDAGDPHRECDEHAAQGRAHVLQPWLPALQPATGLDPVPQGDAAIQGRWESALGRHHAAARILAVLAGAPLAVIRTYGLASPESSAMRKLYRWAMGRPVSSPTADETKAWYDLLEAEKAGIISTNFTEHLERELEPDMLSNILSAEGVHLRKQTTTLPTPLTTKGTAKYAWNKSVIATRDFLRNTSEFIETLPKAAGMYEFKGAGEISDIPADVRQFIRTKVGSPDFLAGGTWKPITNNALLFSNAIMQSWRADWDLATNPTTRGGYLYKTIQTNILPKMYVAAALMAAAGAAGDDDDDDSDFTKMLKGRFASVPWLVWAGRILRKVPSYILQNYVVLPLGTDADGNAVVIRLPQDDSGRVLTGILWSSSRKREAPGWRLRIRSTTPGASSRVRRPISPRESPSSSTPRAETRTTISGGGPSSRMPSRMRARPRTPPGSRCGSSSAGSSNNWAAGSCGSSTLATSVRSRRPPARSFSMRPSSRISSGVS